MPGPGEPAERVGSCDLVWGLTRTLRGRRAVVHGSLVDEEVEVP